MLYDLHVPPPWSSPREGKLEGGQAPTRLRQCSLVYNPLELSWGSAAVT